MIRRLEKFFRSGLMGAALKVSESNRSAWIVDGGSNGGVMKLAGDARKSMGSIGLNIPLIGIAVAIGSVGKDQSEADISLAQSYETEGHSHLILAVDPNGDCPTKVRASAVFCCGCSGTPHAFMTSSHACVISHRRRAPNLALLAAFSTATKLNTRSCSRTLCP